MTSYAHPVQLRVERPHRTKRVHAVTRLLLLLAIGALGGSSIYWALYLGLPALAAALLASKGSDRYLAEDAPRVVRVLRWFASGYAYLWLLTDVLPTADAGPVDLRVVPGGAPTPVSALLRVLTSVPATLLLVILSTAGVLVWIVGLIAVLINERMPGAIADFLTLTLRVQFRLVAYHLSLVDRYPSLAESELETATA